MLGTILPQPGKQFWSHHNPVAIHFGWGIRAKLADSLSSDVRFGIVCSSRGRGRLEADEGLAALTKRAAVWIDNVESNPDISHVQDDAYRCRQMGLSGLVAAGGGSAIDTAKALAVGIAGPPADTLQALAVDAERLAAICPLPVYVLPTTAGTGSEVTPFATLWDKARHRKLSLASSSLFPQAAYVDPELLVGLPGDVVVSTGLDAINQAFESIWNCNASSVSMAYAIQALEHGLAALPVLARNPADAQAAAAMSSCSVLAGLAISQTRTALCHSISYPLTVHWGMPHGLACAFTMLSVFRLNLPFDVARFGMVAHRLGFANVEMLEQAMENLLLELDFASMAARYLPKPGSLTDHVGEMLTPGRATNNLAPPSLAVVAEIVSESVRWVRLFNGAAKGDSFSRTHCGF